MVIGIDNRKVAKVFKPNEFVLYSIYCYYNVDSDERIVENKIYVNDIDIAVGDIINIKEGTYVVEYKYIQEKAHTQLVVRKIKISWYETI